MVRQRRGTIGQTVQADEASPYSGQVERQKKQHPVPNLRAAPDLVEAYF
jgi:hypothetical protein